MTAWPCAASMAAARGPRSPPCRGTAIRQPWPWIPPARSTLRSPVNLSGKLVRLARSRHDLGVGRVFRARGFTLTAAGLAAPSFTVVSQIGTAGFVSKLSADGSTLLYSTYLRAHATLTMRPLVRRRTERLLSAKLDLWESRSIHPATSWSPAARAARFPHREPRASRQCRPRRRVRRDHFRRWQHLNSSTYFGGSQDDGALAAAIDSTGNVILAGQTWSGDFPAAADRCRTPTATPSW
jgi:hypothetical protein